MRSPITFVIPGVPAHPTARSRQAVTDSFASGTEAAEFGGRVLASVRIGSRRATAPLQRLTAQPGEHALLLHVVDGPALLLHPETARDLFLAQSGAAGTAQRSEAEASGEVMVPVALAWPGMEGAGPRRSLSLLGEVWLKGVELVGGFVTGWGLDRAAQVVVHELAELADSQVKPGLYRLSQGPLLPLKEHGAPAVLADAVPSPALVLIHGAFSETSRAFRALFRDHPRAVAALFEHYQGQVYGFDHRTVGESLVANTRRLVGALPQGARLHLLTHSRGGLVADILCRLSELPVEPAGLPPALGTELEALRAEVLAKQITVERVVRVGCPAAGALLASGRLDVYLSVLKWLLKLVGVPIAPQVLKFLHQVALLRKPSKQDIDGLPGLATMMPEHPLIGWLQRAPRPLASELRVVAGDAHGGPPLRWLATLLADGFFFADNDLVVQTRSMLSGVPRSPESALFVRHRGADVHHFSYFQQASIVADIQAALLSPAPDGFLPLAPSLLPQGTDGAVTVGRLRDAQAAERPVLVLVPDTFLSHLQRSGERVWLGAGLSGGLASLEYGPQGDLAPQGVFGEPYSALASYLSKSHRVRPLAYDWRAPLEESARRLAELLTSLLQDGQRPVRVLAHGAGGLLVRVLMLQAPELWRRFVEQPGARLLMVGVPHGGTYAPLQSLLGDSPMTRTLESVVAPAERKEVRQLLAGFPGWLQQQAGLLDPELALGQAETWCSWAERAQAAQQAAGSNGWHEPVTEAMGVPTQEALDQAVGLWQQLERVQADSESLSRVLRQVVGEAGPTVVGLAGQAKGYRLCMRGGDGLVAREACLWGDAPAYTVRAQHYGLLQVSEAFAAYEELLAVGETLLLDRLVLSEQAPGAALRTVAIGQLPVGLLPAPQLWPGLPSGQHAMQQPVAVETPVLQVSVVHGDLRFVRFPLLLGHYRAGSLSGGEGVVDALIGGTMGEALHMGRYPEAPGEAQVFVNLVQGSAEPSAMAPPLAIVIGLGDEGDLDSADLERSVYQGVLAYAQHALRWAGGPPADLDLSTLLIGSGGMGISVAASALAVVSGVSRSNRALRAQGWPLVRHLQFVELYQNRAGSALQQLENSHAGEAREFRLVPEVQRGVGGLSRPPSVEVYRGADYDVIQVFSVQDPDEREPHMEYRVDTSRARTELRARRVQAGLLDQVIQQASADTQYTIGRTLQHLLVPPDLRVFLSGSNATVIEVDRHTAHIPWERLDGMEDPQRGQVPWSIRSRLIRKFRTETYRLRAQSASVTDAILVVGEPDTGPPALVGLPSARAEANAVAELFLNDPRLGQEQTTALLGPESATALAIVDALYARPYRLVHIAGHGEGGPDGGVVMSGGLRLGPTEFDAMEMVPELVFVNCCYSAAGDPAVGSRAGGAMDRPRFAANLAEQLIRLGVRCVVAAGWAVGDRAAHTFARTFYAQLLGETPARFADAVAEARRAAWRENPGDSTWAAYQCYGDPDWMFFRRSVHPSAGLLTEEHLRATLECVEYQLKHGLIADSGALHELELDYGEQFGGRGAIAHGFALAYAAAGEHDRAVHWGQRALAADDGSTPYAAVAALWEQRIYAAYGRGVAAAGGVDDLTQAQQELRAVVTAVALRVEEIGDGAWLQRLLALGYQCLAYLCRVAGEQAAEQQALTALEFHIEAYDQQLVLEGSTARQEAECMRLACAWVRGTLQDPKELAGLAQYLEALAPGSVAYRLLEQRLFVLQGLLAGSSGGAEQRVELETKALSICQELKQRRMAPWVWKSELLYLNLLSLREQRLLERLRAELSSPG